MQRRLTIALVLFVSLIYVGGNYWAAHWFIKWAVLLYTLSFFISLKIGAQFSWWLALPVFWTLHSSLRVWAFHGHNRFNGFLGVEPALVDEFRVISASSESTFLLLVVFFLVLDSWLKKADFEAAFSWLCYLASFMLIFCVCLYGIFGVVTIPEEVLGKKIVLDKTAGTMGNLSMTGCLIAVTWPFVLKTAKKYWLMVLAPVVAIFMAQASQPIGVWLLVLFVVIWGKYKKTHGKWPVRDLVVLVPTVLVPVAVLALSAYFLSVKNDAFFDSNGRAWAILSGFEFFKGFGWWWSGFGLNLTTSLLPVVNNIEFTHLGLTRDSEASYWFWFHSDWFQLFFEMGIIGVIAYAGLFFRCLWCAIRMDYLLAGAVLGWGAMACFNFPVHLPVHAFLGCAFVWMSLRKNSNKDMIS